MSPSTSKKKAKGETDPEPTEAGASSAEDEGAAKDERADDGKANSNERNARGENRPGFLLHFPSDPDLDRLVAAFERGDYATVRTDAELLADRTKDERIRDAALELRRRIDPDPLAKYLLTASTVLLAFLTLWTYFSHDH